MHYPIVDDHNHEKFLLIASQYVEFKELDEIIQTAPLKPNVEIDLVGISFYPTLIQKGIVDPTDYLDNDIRLKNIYLKLYVTGSENQSRVIKLTLDDVWFEGAPEGNGRELYAKYTKTIKLPTKMFGSEDSNSLAFTISLIGRVNVETGGLLISCSPVYNIDDFCVEVVGYDLEYWLVNLNRREK